MRTALVLRCRPLHRGRAAAQGGSIPGRVSGGLAHDLGKPLGVIERLARRLPERLSDPDRARRDARAIASLSAELLAMLREDVGAPHPAEPRAAGERLQLAELVERAVARTAHGSRSARVSVRMRPELASLRVPGPPLVRVLANLVGNALEAGGSEPVEVAAAAAAGGLRIDVVDRGCGMSDEVAARAFEPFFTTRGDRGGTGLGLAVSREIVEALGGRIDLRSAPGRGTRARIWLPAPAPPERSAFRGEGERPVSRSASAARPRAL